MTRNRPRSRGSTPGYAPRVTKQPVELHVISDSTGETAVRLVHALEAQFPDQEFEEIRHPRVETVDDLQLALNRAKGRPAVIVYTLVHPELREAARGLCRRYRLHYCDLLGHPIEADRLHEIRRQRAARLGGDQRAYAELVEIYAELEQAEAIHRRLGCPVIEISDLSIEETAARVIRMVDRRRAENGAKAEAPVS